MAGSRRAHGSFRLGEITLLNLVAGIDKPSSGGNA
jgi:hypothetical protein